MHYNSGNKKTQLLQLDHEEPNDVGFSSEAVDNEMIEEVYDARITLNSDQRIRVSSNFK